MVSEAADDGTLVVTFAPNRARDVPLYVASLPILSKTYYWRGPFEESTLHTPAGLWAVQGPHVRGEPLYEFERVKDWWAADLPVCRGSYNFDILRYDFYRDRDVAFEGFTAKTICTARVHPPIWATARLPLKDGRGSARPCPTIRPRGRTRLVHQCCGATSLGICGCANADNAIDFEWTDKTVVDGAYARAEPPFQNSDMVARAPLRRKS